jgi:poly-beta-1,6-N-acetyl-D-glucosamine synthase
VGIFAIQAFLSNGIFLYALIFIVFIVIMVIVSAFEMIHYFKKNRYISYKELLVSPHAPAISIILPVFNLEKTVIDKVRALFALQYNNFDIIVVNDGSTDATFDNLKAFYDLEPVDYAAYDQIKTQQVYSYSKSKNPTFSRLTVIDKAHGGKSDALNSGINCSEKEFVLCVESECFLDQTSLLKMIKPFLEEKKPVIATRSVVHIANSCLRKNGHLVDIKLPRRLLPAFQVIEYFKTFLIERLAWSRVNGFHAFSNGVGLFDKDVLIQSGGYSSKVLNPEFEVVVRMVRFMHDNQLEFSLGYVSEPICWVDVPEQIAELGIQRKKRASGNLETFKLHKSLVFNSNYGALGMLNLPYLFFYECITPFVEFGCLLFLGLMLFAGAISWEFVGIFISMLYFFAVLLSVLSVLFDERSYRSYTSGKDVVRILLLAFVEPIIYQPLKIYWKISGAFR